MIPRLKIWLIYFIRNFLENPYEKIDSRKIADPDEYVIFDSDPLTGYEVDYYLEINNLFGQSLKSRKLTITYKDGNIQERKNSTSLQESYSIKK